MKANYLIWVFSYYAQGLFSAVLLGMGEDQSEWFAGTWLPRAPLASNHKQGPYYRHARAEALGMAYIEANPLVMQSLVVIDSDHTDTDLAADLAGLPTPTYIATNPHTGTGHIVYGLASPVCLTDSAHRRPINLLARIEQGLTTVLDGDPAYGGRITKNPLVAPHVTLWGDELYELRDLARALGDLGALPGARNPRKTLNGSALGRNVALFDLTRDWAYRAIRPHWGGQLTTWEADVLAYAWQHNETVIANDFTRGPLTFNEVTHLARSIARWTWRNTTRESFHARQTALSKRASEARRTRTQAMRQELI